MFHRIRSNMSWCTRALDELLFSSAQVCWNWMWHKLLIRKLAIFSELLSSCLSRSEPWPHQQCTVQVVSLKKWNALKQHPTRRWTSTTKEGITFMMCFWMSCQTKDRIGWVCMWNIMWTVFVIFCQETSRRKKTEENESRSTTRCARMVRSNKLKSISFRRVFSSAWYWLVCYDSDSSFDSQFFIKRFRFWIFSKWY